jgi:2-methylisocitrate lyase-like PEP mutase family enzyme
MDADTGYGNEMNAKRTIATYARMGLAGVMIEDQKQPKRCGHAKGKQVVDREEAISRVKAACDVRAELGLDIVIIARTDARALLGLEEALERASAFRSVGADVTFVEAPQSEEELKEVGRDEKSGPWKMANMLLFGKTPNFPANTLHNWGFTLAAYPFDLLAASIAAMEHGLKELALERRAVTDKAQVEGLWDVAGFNRYYEAERKYAK